MQSFVERWKFRWNEELAVILLDILRWWADQDVTIKLIVRRRAVVYCVDASEHIVVEFGDGRASAVLMSDILVNETTTLTSACLSLQLVISSSDVDVTIAVSTSLENLATSPKVVTIPSCSPRHPCYWQETVLINSGERLFITGRKFRATRGTLTLVSVTNMSLTPGNCSSDSTESKSFWSSENCLHEYLQLLL